eukprot:scaffold178499_cov30-Tisochrysis_lutea.AAC.7
MARVAAYHHRGLVRIIVVYSRADATNSLLQARRSARRAPHPVFAPPLTSSRLPTSLATPAVGANNDAAPRTLPCRRRLALHSLITSSAPRRPYR